MKAALLATAAVVLAAILGGSKYRSVKNELMMTRNAIDEQWNEAAEALHERAELAPRLIESARAQAPREEALFAELEKARTALLAARTREETIAASGPLDAAISRLLLKMENYSRPKAKNKRFVPLDDELRRTENRFLQARSKYNEALEHYNVEIRKFPTNIVASIAGFSRDDAYFKTEPGARELPKGQF